MQLDSQDPELAGAQRSNARSALGGEDRWAEPGLVVEAPHVQTGISHLIEGISESPSIVMNGGELKTPNTLFTPWTLTRGAFASSTRSRSDAQVESRSGLDKSGPRLHGS